MASRRASERLIVNGLVEVNGRSRTRITVEKDDLWSSLATRINRALGTARLTALHFHDATLKIGLSWPSLSKALGRPVHDPSRWAVLYLGSAKVAELDTDRDIVAIDPDGTIEIRDRAKDLIKSGGEWISSVALENALMGHPAVLEAAVVAIPDERWSERPLAAVVLREGMAATEAELRAYAEALPEGATGKDLLERPRLVADLGDKTAMMLRNHGLLTTGRSVPEAFLQLYRLERACQTQIDAGAAGTIAVMGDNIAGKSRGQLEGFAHHETGGGDLEFAALVRKIDKIDTSWRQ